jgi:hypothetical protein
VTPQMLRLVLGFLAAFVLLSVAPHLPGLVAALSDPALTDRLGDLLLYAAGGLALSILSIHLLRRLGALRVERPRVPGVAGSNLGLRIRQASRHGARVPVLARRFRLSQDAIRVATGREGSTRAAPKGSSFRPRQPALPTKPRATPVAARRTPYRVIA